MVGEGHFISVGLPSAYYGANTDGPQVLRGLVAYAVHCAGGVYVESDLMTVKRGNFVATQAMRGAQTQVLQGDFIDLFDPEMTVKTEITLEAGDSALLYDLSAVRGESVPRLAHTGGMVQGEVVEQAERTLLTLSGPDDSVTSTRLVGNGKAPASVTATRDGKPCSDVITRWDNASQTLLVQTINRATSPIKLNIEWSDEPQPDDPVQRIVEELTPTDEKGLDEANIVRFTGQAYDRRICDGNAELVYRLDLSKYDNPTVVLNVASNYLISVSDHDGDWIEAYNYKTLSGGQWVEGIGNRTALAISPAEYGLGDTLYIKLSNCEPSRGWGGCIYSYAIRYLETVS